MSGPEDSSSGALWIVSTPIGNLGDISDRAKAALQTADIVACEDTRVARRLMEHISAKTILISYHEHNEKERSEELADKIASGVTIALISDAGTPLLSDPGFRLVRACHQKGLPVIPIPGPTALMAALAASGLPAHAFFFAGFTAPKSTARKRLLNQHLEADYSLCLYESCHRIDKLAANIEEVMGPDRMVCFARELTKKFETILRGRICEIAPQLKGSNLKGEFVVIIAPKSYCE